MDELRGPTIQIVLHVKEGLGFGFLKSPVVVSGSLNGYILETDPTVPTHAPTFDAELVWEADKRRFRSLRVQNVPVKIEVYTTGTQGKKDKVGYLLLSLLGAQPCPTNKVVEVKHTWHKLLGVKSEGKCCHPQLLMSLSVEDRVNTLTPRNDLRMFQNNEVAYPAPTNTTSGPVKLTLDEYLQETKSSVSHSDLEPRLLSEEGLIQIGDGQDLFVLAIFIGTIENIDLLLPFDSNDKDPECYITYTIFTHTIKTESVRPRAGRASVHERSSVRVRGALRAVSRALAARPRLHAALCAPHTLGVCSMDLTKLVPTDDLQTFTQNFCTNNVLTIHERCFFVRADDVTIKDTRRAYVDVELSLKYAGLCNLEKPLLTARSATQLKTDKDEDTQVMGFKSESCTNVDQGVGGVAYTNIGSNTARSKNPSGDTNQTKEIAELIRKMYESFTLSQEKLITQLKPVTSDVQVQCEHDNDGQTNTMEREPVKLETSKSDTCIKNNEKYMIEKVLSPSDRSELMKKYVDELEDWKERQQQLFNCQLKRKEEHHLSLLSSSWGGRRSELEGRLSRGVERCGRLAEDLAAAAEDLRRRGHRNSQREKELLDAKKGLEEHYTSKYQELRVASQKMEDDMNHRLKLKDMQVEELQHKVQLLEKQNDVLKNNLKNSEKDIENKYSGLTKDQTASLIQELRNLEEKLDSAVQSKSFFKEQWGRAVRELHCLKMSTRRQMLHTLRTEKRRLGDMSLNPIEDEELMNSESQVDINKLKDDFYVDILANTPALESHSIISKDGLELYDDLKNLPLPKHNSSDRLGTLITQRDELIQHQAPDEQRLTQLNHEIRNMLLNCAS